MHNEKRLVCKDEDMDIEAYSFIGIKQRFKHHFHEYFVIGFIDQGARKVFCQNQIYDVGPGDVILFNPYDVHACEQADEGTLIFRSINVRPERMQEVVSEITEYKALPRFQNVIVKNEEMVEQLRCLHQEIRDKETEFEKEERFYLIIEQLLQKYMCLEQINEGSGTNEYLDQICSYLNEHYMEKQNLSELASWTKQSKYAFIRSFTKYKGITPYRYLETLRINHAKELLEEGVDPIEVAFRSGYADQSHLNRSFKEFIGVTPGQYSALFQMDK